MMLPNQEILITKSMCLFCRIVEQEVPAKIVFEDERSLAFEDSNPQAPVHILVIPKKHITSVNNLDKEDAITLGHLYLVAKDLARVRKIDKSGYRAVINNGPDAGQSVFHLHLHLLGGRPMSWPPG